MNILLILPQGAIGIEQEPAKHYYINHTKNDIMYSTEKVLSIKQNSQYVRDSFRRFAVRVKNRFFTKLRKRQTGRVNQCLHKISNDIVQRAKESKSIIVFEDEWYQKIQTKIKPGSFHELQRQIEYKASGRNPSKIRRSKMHKEIRDDKMNRRKLCSNCGKSMDRDVVASIIVAHKEWARFTPHRGLPDEAMKRNVVYDEYLKPLILRLHGSKLIVGDQKWPLDKLAEPNEICYG